MDGQIISIVFEDESDVIGKIISETETTFIVRYLIGKEYDDYIVYKYCKNPIEIEKACVSGYYDTCDEEEVGFERTGNTFIKYLDADYEPDDTESEYSGTESLDEENFDD